MQSTKKSNSVATSSWSADGFILTINVETAGKIVFDRRNASDANRDMAERMGWNARLLDAMAKSRDKKTGASAKPSEKFLAAHELAEYYERGEVDWKRSGAGGSTDGLLLRALMEYRPSQTRDALVAWLATQSPKQRTGLLNSKQIAPIVARLRAESATDVDADELLDGLDELAAGDDASEDGDTDDSTGE